MIARKSSFNLDQAGPFSSTRFKITDQNVEIGQMPNCRKNDLPSFPFLMQDL